MSAHSVHNPFRRRIRSIDRNTFRDRFNTRRWPISRDHRKSSSYLVDPRIIFDLFSDSWPYPEYRDVWDRIENTFQTEEDFEDLRIQDFVLAGREMTRRRLDRLTMPRGQTLVLERGSRRLRDHERLDASVDTALGYTSVVGTMLAEELANAEDQVGTLDYTCQSIS